ncbi:MAG: hypothetical protein AAF417_15185 [Pseudomonadota bacterium]
MTAVRELQDWSTLARALAAGVLASTIAVMATRWLALENDFFVAAAGAAILGASYAALAWIFGLRWLLPILAGRARWS